MNKKMLFALGLSALFCAVSCNADKPEPQNVQVEEPAKPEGPQAGTYTFTVSDLKGKWNAGDRIYIRGSYGPAAKTITLAESDISEDGRVAVAQIDGVFDYLLKPDNLYAAWPAEAVMANDGILTQSTDFSVFDRHLAVAYLKDNDFSFADASSCLEFSVEGFSDFALSGNQRPGLRFTSYSPSYSSDGANYLAHRDDGYPFLYGTPSGGKTVIWLPGTVKTDGGITIFFGNDGNWTKTYTNLEIERLKAGTRTDLGDITSQLCDYSGPEPKMPEIGGKTKYTLSMEELSGLCMSAGKDFMWTVGDEGDLARISFDGELIDGSKVHIGGDTEAVTLDPRTNDLIIGCEPNSVYKVSYPQYDRKEKLFSIEDASGYGNAGQEGITYYKDGLIYSGMQTSSELYLIDLATGEVLAKKNLRKIFPVITEIADLEYDPLTDWLWIVDSEAKKLFALSGDAENLLGAYAVKTPSNPESLCIDHANGCIWVGDDYGSTSYLYRYEFTGLDDAITK